MTSKRELETVSSVLMLLAGIFMLLGPIQSLARDLLRGSLNGGSLVSLLIAGLALVAFAVTWKGNSTAGGLIGLVVSLYLLFGPGTSGIESAAAAFLLAGGIIAMLAGRSPLPVYPQR